MAFSAVFDKDGKFKKYVSVFNPSGIASDYRHARFCIEYKNTSATAYTRKDLMKMKANFDEWSKSIS